MKDNVVSFGRVGTSEPTLSEEDQARVNAVRLELQEMIFDGYEAETNEHNNPARGKVLSPMPHMYSMLLSDAAILETINKTEFEEAGLETDLQKVIISQLTMMDEAVAISNKVFGTNFQDLNPTVNEGTVINGVLCVGEITAATDHLELYTWKEGKGSMGDCLEADTEMYSLIGISTADPSNRDQATFEMFIEQAAEENKNLVKIVAVEQAEMKIAREELNHLVLSATELSVEQLQELESLGYTLKDAFNAVTSYTDDFAAKPNFEATKEALKIRKETGDSPNLNWYMSEYDDCFNSDEMREIQ